MDKLTVAGVDVAATISSIGNPLLTTLGDNRLVDNLNFIGANLREGAYGETEGGRRRSKKGRRPSFYKHLEPYKEPQIGKGLTLREKAEIFRQRNPEKWEKRLHEKEEQRKVALGIVDTHPTLKKYVESQLQRVKQKKLIEARRKLLPRTVNVEIKYNVSKQGTPRNLGIRRKSDCGPELSLTVVKGKNLFNHSGETEERSEKCCVKALLLPGGERDKNKSDYRYLTTNGTTCWERIFTFPVLSRENMAGKYILISITGQTRQGDKKLIGNAVLAGREALIQMENFKARKPVEAEMIELDKAFGNPEEPVFVQLVLYPKDWTGMKGITIIEQEPPPRVRRASIFAKPQLNMNEGINTLQSTAEEAEGEKENEDKEKEKESDNQPKALPDLNEEGEKEGEESVADKIENPESEETNAEKTSSQSGIEALSEKEDNSKTVNDESQIVETGEAETNHDQVLASVEEVTSPIEDEKNTSDVQMTTEIVAEQKRDDSNNTSRLENQEQNPNAQETSGTTPSSNVPEDAKPQEATAQDQNEVNINTKISEIKKADKDIFVESHDTDRTDDEHHSEFKRGKVVRRKKRGSTDGSAPSEVKYQPRGSVDETIACQNGETSPGLMDNKAASDILKSSAEYTNAKEASDDKNNPPSSKDDTPATEIQNKSPDSAKSTSESEVEAKSPSFANDTILPQKNNESPDAKVTAAPEITIKHYDENVSTAVSTVDDQKIKEASQKVPAVVSSNG